MRDGSFSTGNQSPRPQDAGGSQRHQSRSGLLPFSPLRRAGQVWRLRKDERPPRTRMPDFLRPRRRDSSPLAMTPSCPGRPARGTSPPAASGRPCARLHFSARRRHGDGHETPAAPAPANGSARRGETRTSLFQDGGASVASSRAGGKPAKPSKAAAWERTEGAVAAVGGGPGSFRCCYGCCHAARLGRTSLPRGVIMLTEVSGDGGQCLPVKWGRGRRQPVREHHFSGQWARPSAAGPEELRRSYKCPQSRSCADSTESHYLQLPVPRLSQLPLAKSPLALGSRLLSLPPN